MKDHEVDWGRGGRQRNGGWAGKDLISDDKNLNIWQDGEKWVEKSSSVGSIWAPGNTFSLWRYLNASTGCLERLWDLPLWRYWKAVQTCPGKLAPGVPAWVGVGPDAYHQSSLPISTMWVCDWVDSVAAIADLSFQMKINLLALSVILFSQHIFNLYYQVTWSSDLCLLSLAPTEKEVSFSGEIVYYSSWHK